MQNNTPNNRLPLTQFNSPPCEGAENLTLSLRFDLDADQYVDLSAIQGTGKWSGWETLYIDNSNNPQPVTITTQGVVLQVVKIPAFAEAYMPLLVQNPPMVLFNSTGAVIVRVNILNFFLPPFIWYPTGGSSGAAAARVAPTNASGTIAVGATPQTLFAANASRNYILIHNPSTAVEILQFRINGGGWLDLVAGAFYESTSPVITSLIEVVAATGGHAFTAYSA